MRAQIERAFAQTVRSLRREIGISQERLALGAGINRTYVAGLERGLHTPTLYTMCSCSQACTSLLSSSAGRSNTS